MGWSVGYDSIFERFIGYAVPAVCDHPSCNEGIDRGVSYRCGGSYFENTGGCGLHFCIVHLYWNSESEAYLCDRCTECQQPFEPKPDSDNWVNWLATDDSWKTWRNENRVSTIRDIRELEKRTKVKAGYWQGK